MRDDPFARLGGLDQQLFGARPAVSSAPAAGQPPSPQGPRDGTTDRSKDRAIARSWERSSERSIEPGNEALTDRSSEGPSERSIERHSYDYYHDQVQWLNRMKVQIEERYRRKITSNQMVQLALDLFMADYRRRGQDSALVRRLVRREPVEKGADDCPKDRRVEPPSEGS